MLHGTARVRFTMVRSGYAVAWNCTHGLQGGVAYDVVQGGVAYDVVRGVARGLNSIAVNRDHGVVLRAVRLT